MAITAMRRDLFLAEVEREHGQNPVDNLIAELQLDTVFGLKPGTQFNR